MIYFVSRHGCDENPGTIESPWCSLTRAINRVGAGDVLYIRGGEYVLDEALLFQKSGNEGQRIVYSAYPGESVIIDASNVYFTRDPEKYPFKHETGALFLFEVKHVTIRNVKVVCSHGHGIAIRDSSYISIDHCATENTYCCGISAWDTSSTGKACTHITITGNTVVKATTWAMLPEGEARGHEPPHEAISIAGAGYFEVCENHVHDCDKEGIDVKEVSHHGRVHHNHVHHVDRQGLYADAWFGPLEYVDFYANTVHDCHGAGIVISVEEGKHVSNMRIFDNHVYDNHGSGFLFGIWGRNGVRKDIEIFNNAFIHNGYGIGQTGYFWITGGISLLSAEVYDSRIYDNLVLDNCGFQIGYSGDYLKDGAIEEALEKRNLVVEGNVVSKDRAAYPIYAGEERTALYGLAVCNA